MSLADTINKIAADVEALKSAQGGVDLTPVTTAIADVKADTTAIKAELTPTA